MQATVDVHDLSGDAAGTVGCQHRGNFADVCDRDQRLFRCPVAGRVDQRVEMRNAGPGAGAIHALLRVINATIILSGCIMALTFFCVVVLRYGFSADLFAYEEWLLVIAFWFFFMGSAVATYENSHINADILGIFLSRPKPCGYVPLS